MHFVYIIYSQSTDKYYIGETNDLFTRVNWHNSKQFQDAYTVIADDWEIFWSLQCNNISQARKIEKYIKSMKSRKYIENLIKYPEMSGKLLQRFCKSEGFCPDSYRDEPKRRAKQIKPYGNVRLFYCLYHFIF